MIIYYNKNIRTIKNYLFSFCTALLFFSIVNAQKKQETLLEPSIYKAFKKNSKQCILPDFSYAGYHYGEVAYSNNKMPIFNVTQFGIYPNSANDQIVLVQQLIDSIGKIGGGVIFFPRGKYLFNMDKSKKQFLQINYSNIILRGEGSSENGTIFFNGNLLTQEEVSPWLSPAFIQTATTLQNTKSFWGIDYMLRDANASTTVTTIAGKPSDSIQKARILTTITKKAYKGDRRLFLRSTEEIKPGDVILVGMFNTSTDGNLIKEILSPIKQFDDFELSAIQSGATSAPNYQWLVEVDSVFNNTAILLKQPLRRNIEIQYSPVVAAAPMLKEIGIEHLKITSAWSGYYCHHGCNKQNTTEVKEMDYGWTGITMCRVKHGWIDDVVIDNFTNPIYLLDSRNLTVNNITTSGADGHSGIKIYAHACDNLVTNILFKNNYTHVLSGEGNAYGNVFSSITYEPKSQKPGLFDFHGFADKRFSPPAENLFENIKGLSQINGGGAPNNLPHTANYNTWWNIESGKFPDGDREIFKDWIWSDDKHNLVHQTDHHKMYPKSIVLGFYSLNNKVFINGKTSDTKNAWIYTEQLNQSNIYPKSLYMAQLAFRSSRK